MATMPSPSRLVIMSRIACFTSSLPFCWVIDDSALCGKVKESFRYSRTADRVFFVAGLWPGKSVSASAFHPGSRRKNKIHLPNVQHLLGKTTHSLKFSDL